MTIRPTTESVHPATGLCSLLKYCLEPGTLLHSLKTALVVGTILALINHGQDLLSGQFSWQWVIPMLVAYLVPFAILILLRS